MRHPAVVVGGGPAGSVTALLLARKGHQVLLLDRARFPRAKACGECLNPGAVAALERLGLLDRVTELEPAPLGGWELRTPQGRTRSAPFPRGVGAGLGIDRARLDHALLVEALDAGVEVREGVRVVAVRAGAGLAPPLLELDDGATIEATVVVGADGLGSVVARAVDPDRPAPGIRKASLSVHLEGVPLAPDRGRLVLDRTMTLGLAPLDAGGRIWTLSTVVPSERAGLLPRSPEGLVANACARFPELGGARPVGRALGSGPFDRPARRVVAGGVMLVGDAAGYFDPLTGQGIYRALRSAELAAPVAAAALGSGRTSREAMGSYARCLAREFRPGRGVQRMIEAALARPRLLEAALARLDRGGVLPELVAVTGDARRVVRLLHPRVLLGLLHPSFGS